MATLTVLKFSTPEGADETLKVIKTLHKQELIVLHDGAVVSWPVGKKKPKTKQVGNLEGMSTLQASFWGLLLGAIFFVPVFGLAVGATIGLVANKMKDYGIDDKFIEETREKVTEGTSALFLLTSNAVDDRVKEALKGHPFELIASNLSPEEEKYLKDTFSEEE
jgi:uncharacterized membrane protein